MTLPSLESVVSYFLYGSVTPPTDKAQESLIRPVGLATDFPAPLSIADYMTGPGRFALPSRFELVNRFMSETGQSNGQRQVFTKEELASQYGISGDFGLTFNQALYDDGSPDYAERAFLWASTRFALSDTTRFVIEADGTRHIEGLSVEPYYPNQPENFDFEGGLFSTAVNFFTENWFDPSEIGRRVNFTFSEDILPTRNYTASDYLADLNTEWGWAVPTPSEGYAQLTALRDRLWDAGIIDPVHNGGYVVYGSDEDDVVDPSSKLAGIVPYDRQADLLNVGGFILAGDGDDSLTAAGAETHMYGGSGADSFKIGSNVFVEDGEIGVGDRVYFAGFQLTGGSKQWWMEGNTAYWAPFTSLSAAFPVIGSELIATAALLIDVVTMKFAQYQIAADGTLAISLAWGLGGTAYVKNYSVDFNSGAGTAGITVFQANGAGGKQVTGQRINSYVNLALYAGFGHGLGGYDPLVLDLNGDGFNLVAEDASSAYFEFDSDGFGEHAGWVRGTDGFLVRDANANGKIDNVTEMFGNESTGGFDMLAGYDANLDGKIDASDGVFSSLAVWQDYNQNGVTDAGELKSLSELGIVSISLSHGAPSTSTVIGGNTISQVGSFTRADGSTGGIADVLLGLNETNSRWLGDNSISTAAAALPQLAGFGEIKDLRVAMTGDAVLTGLVQDYVVLQTSDLGALEAGAEDILYRWAGVDGVAAQSLGSDGFDTRKLAFLEKYTGYELMARNTSGELVLDNLDEVEALWKDQLTRLTLRLAVQGPLAADFSGITYNAERDLLVASTPTALGDLLHGLLADLPSDPTAAAAQWSNWAPLLGALTESMVRFDANVVRNDYVFAQLVAAMDGVSQPLSLQQLSSALGIANVQIGTASSETLARAASGTAIFYSGGGDDVLNGGSGQDVYVFGRQIGHSTINDVEARESGDRIRFAFLNRSDVSLARSGTDLLITVTATGETVKVTGQFADVTPGGADLILSSNKGVEDIQFADGTVMEMPAIMIAVGTGTDGDDHLIGTMHSDALTGGKGNDLLQGGDDADLYVINAGDGQDIIQDNQTTPLLRAADMVVFGDGIAPDDLVISRTGASGSDLLFTIGSSGQSVLIQNQFGYTSLGYNAALAINSRIEAFAFREYGDSWSYKDIQQKLIAQSITSGADVTRGFGDGDTFQASAGDDLLIGMDGADTYNWGKGSGNDTIDEQALFIDVEVGLGGISLTTRADTVQFSSGVTLADLAFTRDSSAPDLTVTILSTGEKLTVKNQFAGIQTGVLGAQWFNRVEWFQLADGTRLSWLDVEALVTTGGPGDDRLYGDIVVDTMKGGAGNDTLSGGGAGDTYIFNSGDGHDTLEDANWSFLGEGFLTIDGAPDILQFGPGIAASDISFGRNGRDVDLIVGTTGDMVTLKGQDSYIYTGVFGNLSANRIEEIRFADGTVWTWQQLNQRMIAAATTAGDDVTFGTSTEDVFAASAGNDIIDGGDGSDTYSFGRGSGHDRIRDHVDNIFAGDNDRLNFEAGITLADLGFSREGNDLIITILDTGDSVRIEDQFRWDAWYVWHDVETFGFADGTTLTNADVQQILLTGTPGNDVLTGFSSDDLFDGGAGDDRMIGGDGSDTYVFGRGYGHDVIQESVGYIMIGDGDVVRFAAGISLTDLGFSRDGNDLVITILDSGDSLRMEGQFYAAAGYLWRDVETFIFADGTSITDADLRTKLLIGGTGDDHIVGFVGNDTLDGQGGDDFLEGRDGSDTYLFGRGYGHDVIFESLEYVLNGDNDRIQFGEGISLEDLGFSRDGNDLIITILDTGDSLRVQQQFEWQADFYTWHDIETFGFADGSSITNIDVQQILVTGGDANDTLVGFNTGDTLTGGKGDDLLSGGGGSDTYVYAVGDGNDVVSDYVFYSGSSGDRILLGSGITADMVVVKASTADPSDMILSFNGLPGSITIKQQILGGVEWGVELVEFADGTIWTANDLAYRLNASSGTPGDDVISGTTLNDTLYGGAGNDTISGNAGDDLLKGEAGADTLDGGAGNDRIEGGAGNDLLYESSDNDTYVWNLGDGDDVIRGGNWWDGFNTIEFGPGISAADLVYAYAGTNGSDLKISVVGQAGSITIEGQLSGPATERIDQIRFADGSVLSRLDFQSAAVAFLATTGNDTLWGSNAAETIAGQAGNDTIDGRDGNDRIVGGAGNDLLIEGSGDDTYVWNLGDGVDIVRGGGYWDGFNTVEFGAGILPSDIVIGKTTDARGVVLSVTGQPGSITLESQLVLGASEGIDQIRFADGTIWNRETLQQKIAGSQSTELADTITGTNGPDFLYGAGGDDTIDGRDGNDRIIGGTGNDLLVESSADDTYVWNLGDGDDIIRGGSYWDGFNTIEFGSGIAAADLVYSYADANGYNLKISVASQPGSIVVEGQLSGGATERIDQLRFADGTILSRNQFQAAAYAQLATSGNDTLWGSNANDTITGGAGDDIIDARDGTDRIVGGLGNDLLYETSADDTYVWNLGDGNDIIRGGGYYDGFNTIEFGQGITAADLVYSYADANGYNLKISIAGQPGSIVIEGQVSGAGTERIDQLRFADGTVLSRSQFQTAAYTQLATSGNDTLWGSNANDTITGGAGDDIIDARDGTDRIVGGLGNDLLYETSADDTYVWNLGDGNDIIRGGGYYDGFNTIEFGSGITAADLVYSYADANGYNLKISLVGQPGSIVIEGQLSGPGTERIDQLRFADGTVLSRSQFQAAAYAQLATPGNDTLWGSNANDTITGGAGDDIIDARDGTDRIIGGPGNDLLYETSADDTYVWNLGDGDDIIRGGGYYDGFNTIEFGAGITAADLVYSYADANGYNLKISLVGQPGSIVIEGQLSGPATERIDQLRFADASVLSRGQFQAAAYAQLATTGNDTLWGSNANDTVAGGSGDDTLDGRDGADRLIGGPGNDLILEGSGDDTYVWNLGDGDDIIRGGGWWDGFNTIEFGSGISLANLTFAHTGNTGANLKIGLSGQPGSITVEGWYAGAAGERVDQLRFADNTTAALAATLTALGNNGVPYIGTQGDDLLTPPSGYGVVDAGLGNDRVTLTGNGGGTIVFRSGDGSDILDNTGSGYTRTDTLRLADVAADGVVLRKSGNELSLTVLSTGASFKALQQFSGTGQTFGIGSILFSDGTSWNRSQILDHTILMGTSANDALSLSGGFYHVHAGLGDDTIAIQGTGSGVVEYSRGDGLDILTNPGSGYVRNDALLLTDILPDDVILEKQSGMLHVILKDTGDIVRVSSQFMTDGSNNPVLDFGINEIRFSDGTIWNRSTITTKATTNDTPVGLDLLVDIAQPASRVGSAVRWTSDTYQLTPPANSQNGAIWGDVDLSSDATWTTKIYFGAGDGGADGVAFGFQNAGGAALGTSGVLTATSFGVRFDTWTNPGIEPTSDFSQFVLNGNISATSSQFDAFHLHSNIENGAWHDVSFQWDASTHTLSYSLDGAFVARKTYDAVANLFSGDSTVKFGFGAFTGGLNNNQLVQLVSMKQDVAQFSVREDAPAGTLVGYLAGRDPDLEDTLSYAIVDGNGDVLNDSLFEIVQGNQLRIRAGARPDFETEAEHLVRIRTTDLAGASRVDEVRVAILDVAAQTLTGTAVNDSITGTGEADTMSGMAGNDWLSGGDGADVLQGGDGNDVLYGDGRKAIGSNLVVNGGFEDLGDTANNIRRDWGVETADMAGWVKINSQPYEANFSGTQSIPTSEGTYWLDMMVGAGTAAQMDIRQSFSNLAAGEQFLLQFDVARPSAAGNATIEALWNGTVVATISDAGVQMKTVSRYVTAAAGSNQLQFRTTAGPSYYGVSLDNVRLFATEASAGGNDQIDGGAGTDTVVFAGNQADYTVSTVNGTVTVTDNQPLTDGNDGVDTLSGVETITFKDASVNLAAPIVLDLNGNGVTIIDNKRTKVGFDWDRDGRKDQTGWIGTDDGFLFIDRDGNGTVTNAGELSFASDKEGAKSDLDGLRAFDSNGDGIFSSADDQFSQFKVWRDKNDNGRVDKKEILSLQAAGVASIDLTGEAVNQSWEWGENITVNTGTFTRTNGTVGSFSDVALSYDTAGSQNAAINKAASQLSEAMAGFWDGRGIAALSKFEALAERRDSLLAVVHGEWR